MWCSFNIATYLANHFVQDKLGEYNSEQAAMNLVLFDDAVLHVCRICQ